MKRASREKNETLDLCQPGTSDCPSPGLASLTETGVVSSRKACRSDPVQRQSLGWDSYRCASYLTPSAEIRRSRPRVSGPRGTSGPTTARHEILFDDQNLSTQTSPAQHLYTAPGCQRCEAETCVATCVAHVAFRVVWLWTRPVRGRLAPSLDCLSLGRLLLVEQPGRPSSSRHRSSVVASPLRRRTGLCGTQKAKEDLHRIVFLPRVPVSALCRSAGARSGSHAPRETLTGWGSRRELCSVVCRAPWVHVSMASHCTRFLPQCCSPLSRLLRQAVRQSGCSSSRDGTIWSSSWCHNTPAKSCPKYLEGDCVRSTLVVQHPARVVWTGHEPSRSNFKATSKSSTCGPRCAKLSGAWPHGPKPFSSLARS